MQVSNQQKKPDYEFDAFLHYPDRDRLLCNARLWLPKHPNEDARLTLFVPQIHRTDRVFCYEPLFLKSETWESTPTLAVTATDLHIKTVNSPLNVRKAGGTKIELLYVGCIQIEQLLSTPDSKSINTTEESVQGLLFALSELKYAKPRGIPFSHYLGDYKTGIQKTCAVEVDLPSGTAINFSIEKHYSRVSLDEHTEITSTRPVLAVKENNLCVVSQIDHRKFLADDLALLISLAARHRVFVIGFEFATQQRVVRHFLNPLERNRIAKQEDETDYLIPIESFEDFLHIATGTFLKISELHKSLIRNAIMAMQPLHDLSAESHFLAMFAALEALCKTDHSEVSPEILDAWTNIEQALKESIDEKLSFLSIEARQFLQQNLKQVKQGAKTQKKLIELLNRNTIYRADLFPLFGHNSLTWIRNKIAHGEDFSSGKFAALLRAHDHLSVLLERIVLRLLGANCEKSAVGLERFRNDIRYLSPEDLRAIQQKLN